MSRLNNISRVFVIGISLGLFLGLSNVVDALLGISAGGSNTCIILDNQVTKCFGRGGYNGDGTAIHRGNTPNSMSSVPQLVWGTDLVPEKISMNGILDGANYDATTCGIVYDPDAPTTTRALKCFGSNKFGLCGIGRTAQNSNITLGDDPGEVVAELDSVDLGDDLYPVDVAVGVKHACAIVSKADLTVDRQVKCWGDASQGALGNGATTGPLGEIPEQMGESLPFMTLPSGAKALAIGAGNGFTCVIISDTSNDHGDVYCTGSGENGRTGQGSTNAILAPAKVELGTGKTARKIAVGTRHACALIEQDDQIKCWGEGFYSAQGNPDNTEDIGDALNEMDTLSTLSFGGGLTVLEVAAGEFHTCVILSDNKVRCFGGNNAANGNLGQESGCDRRPSFGECEGLDINNVAALPISELGTGVVPGSLALGSVHSCALVTGSFLGVKAKCWGSNEYGATGVESTTNYGTGGLSSKMGDVLPFLKSGDPAITEVPSASPTTSRPSKSPSFSPTFSQPSASPVSSAPSKSPITSSPSASPTTSRPSSAPSFAPSLSPTVSKSPTSTPTVKITSSPFTESPTVDTAAAAVQQATVIGGAVGGSIVFILAAFVLYSRRKDLCGAFKGGSSSQVNWLEEAQKASADAPSTYTLPSGAQGTVRKANKYNAPPMNAQPNLGYNERYRQPAVAQALPVAMYESGNPVFAGVAQEANARLSMRSTASAAAAAPPAKPTREHIVEKLRTYYQKVDPNKKSEDINDLATWVMLNSEEALYVKLRKKYGSDPNTIMQTMNMATVDDVDV